MSDLYIEARLQAIKEIASASCSDIKDADNIAGFCDEIYSAIPKLDKIIEELEQKKTKLLSYARDYEKIGNFEQAEIYSQIASEYTTAIEIVKQGGVSDASDNVCEWRYTKEIMDNTEFKVGCNTNALKRGVVPNNFSYHDFKYCPYCGKKIKIVGD